MPKLEGQTIWITGASSGIGEALARRLARLNCRLAVSARRVEKLESLVTDARRKGAKIEAFPADVTDLAALHRTADEIRRKFGPITMLVTSHGAYEPAKIEEFDAESYGATMKVNFQGTLNCLETVLPQMKERRRGHLVPIASLTGYFGLPNSCPYTASKAALINFFEGLSFDVMRYRIGVTIVNPGFVRTQLTDKNDFPMPFIIEPDEAAEHIVEGLRKNRKEIHFPWQLSWMFKAARLLPYPLFDRLVAKQML